MNPTNLKYTKTHEWVKVDGNIVTLGITNHAQESLGDVVFVELPEEGTTVTAGEPYGTVESVKAVSDIISAVNGKVVEFNEAILDAPDVLNSDPYGEGWLIKVEADDLSELDNLLSAAEYEGLLEEEH
ncbi:glycine cleavage system protein GcvH [Desulfitobacterium sp.]|uniref:glycine cleavage system protein GcvH n=1 Tax=Desulfitobacterium sp. TaxID=49981 RepID=UPI002B1EA5E2|nr:glycine cleavage system protein GcvH [Desulfitobacterium sp.]MEA4900078.1 glycine cleavage system protein GcvH [Desulfitobacterium sp.]